MTFVPHIWVKASLCDDYSVVIVSRSSILPAGKVVRFSLGIGFGVILRGMGQADERR